MDAALSLQDLSRAVEDRCESYNSCFWCVFCSLLSYTTFDGAFYCKVHHKLLSETKGPSQEENSHVPQKLKLWLEKESHGC
uniref:LIM zinc-binding domain-containing protein n=1 Tax=Anolis carolinensis TaxID=28377 RepID=A0A803TYF0_ANOCA